MAKRKAKAKPKGKVFGNIDLWDFIDKEGLQDYLEITEEDWDNYDIQFRNGTRTFTEVSVVGLD